MWFEKLLGFKEEYPDQVRSNIEIKENKLISKVNGNEFVFGSLEVPTLNDLRIKNSELEEYKSKIRVSEVVGNIQDLHQESTNNGALFQAASQFNLLEMVGPQVIPEKGVGIYENDYTQGPACAIACGAGTIYRNYFANVNNQIGQTSSNQIDCLSDIGLEFKNEKSNLWEMTNGYALANSEGLSKITRLIKNRSELDVEKLKGKLRIGLQRDTEVTINMNKNIVTQAYCSALPVAYSHLDPKHWESFARLILEATYEATLYAAVDNYKRTGNNKVFLTLVGGGAFGNNIEWIFDALVKAVYKFARTPLDVRIVSYGSTDMTVKNLIESIK
ncbi:hypothetical protein [Carboxylicivirga sp. N1Y90]|uniref:hypothetical protein n=1 Tax=Carboxylicivirga fragile TaxID=3417571 RepID=UPI003D32A600|nr:hypothetical protein [Marinilabiliaceae bacterium N1Y90]